MLLRCSHRATMALPRRAGRLALSFSQGGALGGAPAEENPAAFCVVGGGPCGVVASGIVVDALEARGRGERLLWVDDAGFGTTGRFGKYRTVRRWGMGAPYRPYVVMK